MPGTGRKTFGSFKVEINTPENVQKVEMMKSPWSEEF